MKANILNNSLIEIENNLENLNDVIQLQESDKLGEGSFAPVYKYLLKNHFVAVKCYKDQVKAQEENQILTEIKNLTNQCLGIVPYYGMKKILIEITGGDNQIYQGCALFFDYCETDLQKFMLAGNKLPFDQVLDFLIQICTALIYLNLNGCYHRDIKPGNILMNQKDSKWKFYLTDFGESKILSEEMTTDSKTLTLRGTPFYFAPELDTIFKSSLNWSGRFNPIKTDMYALGIIVLQLLFGENEIFKLTT